MATSKLILVEGLPGTGKSTIAQAIARQLAADGRPVKWWYEEEKGHPVYLFRNEQGLGSVLKDLRERNFEDLIRRALSRWRTFADTVERSDQVVVMDGCLLGYLTWSLFPAGAEEERIAAYVQEVAQILAPISPKLVALATGDIEATFRHIGASRGPGTEARFIRQSAESAYGRRHSLDGFSGMVRYWRTYESLARQWLALVPLDKLLIEHCEINPEDVRSRILAFLQLEDSITTPLPQIEREGTYSDGTIECRVYAMGGALYLDGFGPPIWPQIRLIPSGADRYQLESLPVDAEFRSDPDRLLLKGPELFGGTINHELLRITTRD